MKNPTRCTTSCEVLGDGAVSRVVAAWAMIDAKGEGQLTARLMDAHQ